jgi:DNA-binding CsgD family transcriptional regulator
MPRASHRSLKKLSDALLELHSGATLEEFPGACLRATRKLIGADVYTFDAFDMQRMHGVFVTWPDVVPGADVAILNAQLHEHPSLSAIQKPNSRPVVKWSDFVTLRQFRQTGLYHDFFRASGTRHQLALAFVGGEQTSICAVLNRRHSDFAEDDRVLLQIISPHLEQSYRKAAAVSHLRRVLDWRDHAFGSEAVMLIAEDGMILFSTESAQKICRDYFGECQAMAPRELRERFKSPPGESRFTKEKGSSSIVLHWTGPVEIPGPPTFPPHEMSRTKGYVVRITEQHADPSQEAALRLGLTRREAEVLTWLAQGKRNAEIGTILGMRPRTVEKHVEHIMSKLGTETRSAAAAMLWDTQAEKARMGC